jgi:hypothetical protein
MTDLMTSLYQNLRAIRAHADAAISAMEQESDDALLQALGKMDAANHNIRLLVTARVEGHAKQSLS